MQTPQPELGLDGHARRGGFIPALPGFPRRMRAGSRLSFLRDIRVGDDIVQLSRIFSVKPKTGASGNVVFVTAHHEYSRPGETPSLIDEHDIVYRSLEAPAVTLAPRKLEAGQWHRSLTPDPVLLFRYLALTFNGHRIHHDRDFGKSQEGYADLIVHGPLIATLLIDLIRRNVPVARVDSFSFRAVLLLFDGAENERQRNIALRGRRDLAVCGQCRWRSGDVRQGQTGWRRKAHMIRPLDGLLVVSLERAIAAPYCTRLLAAQGARVIKVKRPDGGDFARSYDTRERGLASRTQSTLDAFVKEQQPKYDKFEIKTSTNLEEVVRGADVVVTLTPARGPIVMADWISPGTHIAAVGAGKKRDQELERRLLKGARIFVDDIRQCRTDGEINVPPSEGLITEADIAGEIGEVIIGRKPGRISDTEITIFDSTGIALQDSATVPLEYERALAAGVGIEKKMIPT